MPYMFKRDAETGIWGNEMAYDGALENYLTAGFFEDRRVLSEAWMLENGKLTDLQKELRREYELDHGVRANTAEIGYLNADRRRKETGTPMGPAYEREGAATRQDGRREEREIGSRASAPRLPPRHPTSSRL